ncbi:MAG: HEAT repeat domain-containing protein, partial [Planctomycetaceae bacterium]
ISFKESEVAARLRQQQLREDLMDPAKAAKAALQFEAIGRDSIPFLKRALEAHHLESRFHSAVALAYLGDPSGVPQLAQAIREEPNYRAHAFAALSVIEDTDALLVLRELMSERSPETRYGAFRALTVLDETDLSLQTEKLPDGFRFHELDLQTEPMIHLTKHQKPEVVLFGKGLKFKLPVALFAGRHIMIRGQDGGDSLVISRYQVGKPEIRETVPNSIAGVIRHAVSLGASYPDIAELLMQARRQHNLPCDLEIDALPKAYNSFRRAGNSSAKEEPKTSDSEDSSMDDSIKLASGMEIEKTGDDSGRASAIDMRGDDEPKRSSDSRPTLRDRFSRMFRRSKNK